MNTATEEMEGKPESVPLEFNQILEVLFYKPIKLATFTEQSQNVDIRIVDLPRDFLGIRIGLFVNISTKNGQKVDTVSNFIDFAAVNLFGIRFIIVIYGSEVFFREYCTIMLSDHEDAFIEGSQILVWVMVS